MIRSTFILILSCLILGCSFFAKPVTIDPINDPEVTILTDWMVQASDGERSFFQRLQPAIYANKIYVTDAKSNLTVIDAENGNGLWQTRMAAGLPSSPSLGAGRVYVGTNEAKILAFNADTGEKLWEKDVSNQVLAQPTYSNGLVIVKTINGELIALNAENGKEQWRFIEELPRLILRAHSAAQAAYPIVIAGFPDGKVVALSVDKGQLVWEHTIAHPSGFSDLARMVDIEADPVIHDDIVYVVSYQGNLAALQISSSQQLWERQISSYSGLVVANDRVFVSDDQGYVWALESRTGKVIWRQNGLANRHITAPQASEKYIVIADDEGFIHWLDQTDGHFVSRQFLSRSGIVAQPVRYQDNILVLSRDGMLVSLKVKQ